MEILLLFAGVFVFSLTLRQVGIVPVVERSVGEMKHAGAVLRSDQLSDADKEATARRAAAAMSMVFLGIIWRLIIAAGAAALAIAAGLATGLSRYDRLEAAATDPLLLGLALIVSIAVFLVRR